MSTPALRRRRPPRLGGAALAVVVPLTMLVAVAWPAAVLGSLVPVVGFLGLPVLFACTAALFLLIPTTLHLLLAQPHSPTPPLLPSLSPLNPLRSFALTFHALRLLLDVHHARLVTLFLDALAKRVLLLGGKDAGAIVRENIVYVEATPPLYPEAKRLDVYLPSVPFSRGRARSPTAEKAPVVVLLCAPTYRHTSKSLPSPSPSIALRLRRLGACVVVPALTPYSGGMEDGEALRRMVGEVREVLKWVGESVGRYGGDGERVWVLGHGAGGHVGLLAIIQSAAVAARTLHLAEQEEREQALREKERKVTVDGASSPHGVETSALPIDLLAEVDAHRPPTCSDGTSPPPLDASFPLPVQPLLASASLFTLPSLFSPSPPPTGPEDRGESLASFVLPSGKRVAVRGVAMVGASYDVLGLKEWEDECGLSEVSSLTRVCGTSEQDLLLACPSHLVHSSSPLLSLHPSLLPARFLLLHGGRDPSVPFSQAVLFRNLLIGVGLKSEDVRLRLYRDETGWGGVASLMHTTPYSLDMIHELEQAIFDDTPPFPSDGDVLGSKSSVRKPRPVAGEM
ncbi:hypothetical protein JCM10207_002673 [Rhodosporidiobolus poonsookiae]